MRRGRMGYLAGRAAPGVGLGARVGLRSTAEVTMASGEAAVLAAVQPVALLTVGANVMRVRPAVLAGARAAGETAGVMAGVLAGTRTPIRLIATR